MNREHCYCVIMAGGTGVRFWPVSRAAKPKQFLDVADTGKTFIQSTYERFLKVVPKENILIVTGDRYHDIVMEQIPDLAPENLLLEPYSRNTAPCIAYATYTILKRDPQARVVVTPSDHMIDNAELFAETISNAFDYIEGNDILMTLGVVPTRPDTNYGYIQACGGSDVYKNDRPMQVKTFTEKPDRELAKVFISTGEFFWNAGIFIWNVNTIINAFRIYQPEIAAIFTAMMPHFYTENEQKEIDAHFPECPNISVDYAILEKSDEIYVFPADFGWSDLGTWGSLYDLSSKDENSNATLHCEARYYDSHGNIVTLPKGHMAVIQGVENCIIAQSNGVLLICKREEEQQIRQFHMDAEDKWK